MTSIRRRHFLQLLGAAGAASLAGCAGPGSQESGRQTTAAALSSDASGSMIFSHWRAEDQQVFDDLLTTFAKTYPDISVTQDIAPSADYQASALQRLRSGDTGDAFPTFRGAQFNAFADAGVYADLGDLDLVGNYPDELAAIGRADDIQLAVPYQVVFLDPVVNLDLLDKAGVSEVPTDWDGYLAMLDALKGTGVVPFGWPGGDTGNLGQLVNTMVMNNAPSDDMFTQVGAGELKLTDDWFLKTLGQYAELAPYMQEGVTGTLHDTLLQRFAKGDVAIIASGSYAIAPARAAGAKFPVDLAPPVTVAADEARYVGVHNATFLLGVNSASENQDAAVAWVDFLSQPENASVYADATAQHVGVEGVTYGNADLKQLERWLTADTLLAPRFQLLDLDVQAAVDQSTVAVVRGTSPEQAAEEAQAIVDQQIG
ncbi:ABC transporter substrate-binding protein [Nocardioides sp. Soil805]|nr:ABC transporter substrate-binding protein [Nocardioides sp. Soil805]